MPEPEVEFSWHWKHTIITIACVLVLLVMMGWIWFLIKLILWSLFSVSAIVAICSGVYWRRLKNLESSSFDSQQAQQVFLVSAVTAMCFGVVVWSIPSSHKTTPQPIPPSGTDPRVAADGNALGRASLALASVTLFGSWEESDAIFNDRSSWSGTAFVVSKGNGTLTLYTNSHCLNLGGLSQADDDGSIEVFRYQLSVKFPTGVIKQVRRIGEESTNLDLACIEVDSDNLTEGKDYIVVPDGSNIPIDVGDKVIAVGSPLDEYLAGTHTFGSVSAIRETSPAGVKCRTIQHDAAINHGNSGGPLFLDRDGNMYWVGVNTWVFANAQGIFFSIAAQEARNANYMWAEATPKGAAQLLDSLYGVSASVASH